MYPHSWKIHQSTFKEVQNSHAVFKTQFIKFGAGLKMKDWRNLGEEKKRLFYMGTGSKIAMCQKEAWELSWVGMVERGLIEREKIFWGRSIKGWGVWKAIGEFYKSCSGPFLNLMYHCMLVILTFAFFFFWGRNRNIIKGFTLRIVMLLKNNWVQNTIACRMLWSIHFPFFPFFNLPRSFSPRQMMRVAVKSTQLEVGY